MPGEAAGCGRLIAPSLAGKPPNGGFVAVAHLEEPS
jgi:hypothetical protein